MDSLEKVETKQEYGIWVKPDPRHGGKSGWVNSFGTISLFSEQKAKDFIHGLPDYYVIRPIHFYIQRLENEESN